MFINRSLIFVLFAIKITCFGIIPSFGQSDFRRYIKADGLSSNRTFEAVEDEDGFVWISTDEGIDRFDGKNFIHYKLSGGLCFIEYSFLK